MFVYSKQDTGYSSSDESMKGRSVNHYPSVELLHTQAPSAYRPYRPIVATKSIPSLHEEGEAYTRYSPEPSSQSAMLAAKSTPMLNSENNMSASMYSKYRDKHRKSEGSIMGNEGLLGKTYGEQAAELFQREKKRSKSSSALGSYNRHPEANIATVHAVPAVEKHTAEVPDRYNILTIPAETGKEPDVHVNFTYDDIQSLGKSSKTKESHETPSNSPSPPPPIPVRGESSLRKTIEPLQLKNLGADIISEVEGDVKRYSPVYSQKYSPLQLSPISTNNFSKYSSSPEKQKLVESLVPASHVAARTEISASPDKSPLMNTYTDLEGDDLFSSAYIPHYDSNGHKYGDEKYDAPSPPERDFPVHKKNEENRRLSSQGFQTKSPVEGTTYEVDPYENIWEQQSLRKAAEKHFVRIPGISSRSELVNNRYQFPDPPPKDEKFVPKHQYTVSQTPLLSNLERERHELSKQYKSSNSHCDEKKRRKEKRNSTGSEQSYIEYHKDRKGRSYSEQSGYSQLCNYNSGGLQQIEECRRCLQNDRRQGSDPVRDTDEYIPKDDIELQKKRNRMRASYEDIGRLVSDLSISHSRSSSNPEAEHLRQLETRSTFQDSKMYRLAERKLDIQHKVSDSGISDMGSTHERDNSDPDKLKYFDPEKRHKVSDPELKAIQHNALVSFYAEKTGQHPQRTRGGILSPTSSMSSSDMSQSTSNSSMTSPTAAAWETSRYCGQTMSKLVSPKTKSFSFPKEAHASFQVYCAEASEKDTRMVTVNPGFAPMSPQGGQQALSPQWATTGEINITHKVKQEKEPQVSL